MKTLNQIKRKEVRMSRETVFFLIIAVILLAILFVIFSGFGVKSCVKWYKETYYTGIVKEKYYQPASAGGYGHGDIEPYFLYIMGDGKEIKKYSGEYFVGDTINLYKDVCKEYK